MSNVVKASTQIKEKINAAAAEGGSGGTLNFLVLSCGTLDFKGFEPTEEGIDSRLALRFYARWKVSSSVSLGTNTLSPLVITTSADRTFWALSTSSSMSSSGCSPLHRSKGRKLE